MPSQTHLRAELGDQLSGLRHQLDRLVGELAGLGLLTLDARDDLISERRFTDVSIILAIPRCGARTSPVMVGGGRP